MDNVLNPNYAYMVDTIFDQLDCIFMYRQGIRSDDFNMMHASRAIYAKVWVSRGHTMYRELELNDRVWWSQMPAELKSFVKQTLSFNLSGQSLTGEGADFRLEEINKGLQNLVGGTPTSKKWKSACANFNEVQQLRKYTYIDLGVKDPKIQRAHSPQALDDQVLASRALIREKKYLSDPCKKCPHTSLLGAPLDTGLVDFGMHAEAKWERFCHIGVAHMIYSVTSGTAVPFNEPPLFVTPQERLDADAVRNKTIKDLSDMCTQKIMLIKDSEMQAAFQTDGLVHGSKVGKNDYIKFYNFLLEYLDVESQLVDYDTSHGTAYSFRSHKCFDICTRLSFCDYLPSWQGAKTSG